MSRSVVCRSCAGLCEVINDDDRRVIRCADHMRAVARGMGEMGEVMSNFELTWSVFGPPSGHIVIEADDLPDDLSETDLCALAYRKIDEQVQITAGPNWDSLTQFVKWAKESKGRAVE